MKRIIFSVLALGLSMGLMAQKVYNGAEPIKGKLVNVAKSGNIVYPESFEDCASVDDPMIYTEDGQSLWLSLSGTNDYGDMAYGQRYTGSYQVTGIAAVMTNLSVDGSEDELSAAVVDMNGNELASVAFTTADLPATTENLYFDLVEFDFASPVNASDFLATVSVAPFQYDEEGNIFGNLSFVASTEIGCSSGDMAYSYSIVDEAGNYGWISIYDAWGGADLDLFIFPKVSGVGLSEVELNSLSYVYPNPAKEEVMLASSVNVEKVEIYNVLGQVVYSADVNANSVKVNTADFAAGNYVVKMYTEGGVATKKLVVE
ncbi:MAG: T9SS type A sorting domain-containing protein [Bacteroidales bacterium]|nr:T9SS type A sorting domain-containing protein [Bacteroidales bacterium]